MTQYCQFSSKIIFLTRGPAEKALMRLRRDSHHNVGSIYRCPYCHQLHITHWQYEIQEAIERNVNFQKPNKKQLRSLRNRKKTKIPKPFKGEKLFELYKQSLFMSNIHTLMRCEDTKKLSQQLSYAFGLVKTFCGASHYCAIHMMHEAMVSLQKCSTCRHNVKYLMKQVNREWNAFEHRLKYPPQGELIFFSLAEMDAKYRRRYRENVTVEEYFDFWTGLGGRCYVNTKDEINTLTHKFRRFLQRIDSPYPDEYALAMTATTLLQLADSVWTEVVCNAQSSLMPIHPSFRELSSPFSIKRILDAWTKMADAQFGSSLPPFLDEESYNIDLTVKDIIDKWTDPIFMCDIQAGVIEDFSGDVFRTNGEVKKVLILNNERREELQNDIMQMKIEKLKNTSQS